MSESKCGRAGCRNGMRLVASLVDPDDAVWDICPYCEDVERRRRKNQVLTFATLQQSTAGEHQAAGRRQMLNRIRTEFATFATRHPDPIISDELWQFVNHLDRMET